MQLFWCFVSFWQSTKMSSYYLNHVKFFGTFLNETYSNKVCHKIVQFRLKQRPVDIIDGHGYMGMMPKPRANCPTGSWNKLDKFDQMWINFFLINYFTLIQIVMSVFDFFLSSYTFVKFIVLGTVSNFHVFYLSSTSLKYFYTCIPFLVNVLSSNFTRLC